MYRYIFFNYSGNKTMICERDSFTSTLCMYQSRLLEWVYAYVYKTMIFLIS